jgi:hypothetical protein
MLLRPPSIDEFGLGRLAYMTSEQIPANDRRDDTDAGPRIAAKPEVQVCQHSHKHELIGASVRLISIDNMVTEQGD